MKVEIHNLAVKEFDDAIDWYEMQAMGLGERFKKHVIDQVQKIKKIQPGFLLKKISFIKRLSLNFPIKFYIL